MARVWLICFCLVLQLGSVSLAAANPTNVPILCYHDVGKTGNDMYTVTKETLEQHFAYLRQQGYHPISLQQYIAFARDGAPLPDKPVMITFDDGYISFYTDVFPLLQKYNYPAMLAIVGFWLEYPPPEVGPLANWQQLREMEASGLVAVASHSYKSHYFKRVNPQGDRGNALADREYGAAGYETEETFRQRVEDDLRQAQRQFERELGHKAAAMVWPYGAYTMAGIEMAQRNGFQAAFTLDVKPNVPGPTGLWQAYRAVVVDNPGTDRFPAFLRPDSLEKKPIKVVTLSIDTIYEPDNLRATDSNLQMVMKHFEKEKVSAVCLQAVSTDSANGRAESAYFPNRVLPVKADIFSHIAAKLRKAKFLVYAAIPNLSLQYLAEEKPIGVVAALYSDLAAYTYVDGVLFQDDLPLTHYRRPETKADALDGLTEQIMREFRQARPITRFARTIPAEAVVNPIEGANAAKKYQRYLTLYDYTVITIPPAAGQQAGAMQQRLEIVTDKALKDPSAANKVIFQVETFDFERQKWHTEQEIKRQTDILRSKGGLYFSYYPDSLF
ncbi:MAG: Poly-beta,6-N-acetyl-D-glucosamine N-deacetylase PgaB [Firmicutes bacterium]|nr:Poly-beta,6-N-acetyl-D-glucosamine N-deacetylase PgaB [Bacillota bacterium]